VDGSGALNRQSSPRFHRIHQQPSAFGSDIVAEHGNAAHPLAFPPYTGRTTALPEDAEGEGPTGLLDCYEEA